MKDFSTLSDILNDNVFASKKMGYELNKCCAFKFWDKIVGKKFDKFSKPYSLKGTTLFVSVKNSTILQELSFYKADIIKKLIPYFEPLNLTVKDIRFDYKSWGENTKEATPSDDDFYPCYTKEDLNLVTLTAEEENELEQLASDIDNISFLKPELKEKYFNDILNQFKARKLRKQDVT